MTEANDRIYVLKVKLEAAWDGSTIYRWYGGVRLPNRTHVFAIEDHRAFPMTKENAERRARLLWYVSARNFNYCILRDVLIDLHWLEKEKRNGNGPKGA